MSTRRGIVRPQMQRQPDPRLATRARHQRWLADPAERAAWRDRQSRAQQARRARERQRALGRVA